MGVAVATVDGEPVVSYAHVAWINYLLGEKRNIKNFDPWKLYETFIDTGRELPYYIRWKDFGYHGYSLIGSCEIYAVIYGIEDGLPIYKEKKKEELEKFAIDGMKLLWRSLKSFKGQSALDEKEQLKVLLNLFQIYCDKGPKAEDNYYRIYTFAEFFEETIENLNDIRFLALWKLYEEILRDPKIKAAGDVIFVPNGPEYENQGLHYWGENPKRRLWRNWDVMDLDKQNNTARVILKRYMALMANKELRVRVFGF